MRRTHLHSPTPGRATEAVTALMHGIVVMLRRARAGCVVAAALALGAVLFAAPAAAAPHVLIVTSDHSGAFAEAEAALRRGLRLAVADSEIATTHADAFANASLNGTRVVVTLGSVAAIEVGKHDVAPAVLNTLLPRQVYRQLAAEADRTPTSAIYIDQPVARQVDALAEVLPGWRQLGLIAGPQTSELAAELEADALSRGYNVLKMEIDSDREIYPAMRRILERPAVLLALPDRLVFNNSTIQNILLTTYRQRSPVIGFSPAYVRAGAVAALYSTPTQIGDQAAATIRDFLRGTPLPEPQYPQEFEIAVNDTVARSLGIRLEAAEVIAERIRAREAKR